jgi:hypothetical protein
MWIPLELDDRELVDERADRLSHGRARRGAEGGARVVPAPARHERQHGLVDALDEVVARLVELVDAALGGGHARVVAHARVVLLVPEVDVGLRQARDEGAERVGGGGRGGAGASGRSMRGGGEAGWAGRRAPAGT